MKCVKKILLGLLLVIAIGVIITCLLYTSRCV